MHDDILMNSPYIGRRLLSAFFDVFFRSFQHTFRLCVVYIGQVTVKSFLSTIQRRRSHFIHRNSCLLAGKEVYRSLISIYIFPDLWEYTSLNGS